LLQLSADLKGVQAWVERARGRLQAANHHREKEPEGATQVWEPDGKEMVRIPAGTFLYGDDKEERELPEFWIDTTPVTNAEYARFISATDHKPPQHWKGEHPPKEIAAHPVTYVSWYDAMAYAEWAGKRLPTEEEWEKAARGTDGRTYPWGEEEPTPDLCNFGENEGGTTPVGKYSPQGDSPYECVDMAGNVWEWTASDYDDKKKVLRGGSWGHYPYGVRCANRIRNGPDVAWDNYGFRCARGS
jgi:formylglycine-generating enzyme required for sulfatase activity